MMEKREISQQFKIIQQGNKLFRYFPFCFPFGKSPSADESRDEKTNKMKQERTLTKFICDECKKEGTESEQPRSYPYNEGWVYLYNFKFKLAKDKDYTIADKHFCCKECFIKFLMRKLE